MKISIIHTNLFHDRYMTLCFKQKSNSMFGLTYARPILDLGFSTNYTYPKPIPSIIKKIKQGV
jgi:hypothetical protein